jgi:hypothetical protein
MLWLRKLPGSTHLRICPKQYRHNCQKEKLSRRQHKHRAPSNITGAAGWRTALHHTCASRPSPPRCLPPHQKNPTPSNVSPATASTTGTAIRRSRRRWCLYATQTNTHGVRVPSLVLHRRTHIWECELRILGGVRCEWRIAHAPRAVDDMPKKRRADALSYWGDALSSEHQLPFH